MSRRVTLKDIAAKSGFSRSTVSLVMQNDEVVASKTRLAVQTAAAELGYVYNRAAASLRSNQSGIFGLVVSSLSNPFFAEMILGIENAFAREERTVLLGQHSESLESQDRMIRKMLEASVDGILLVPTRNTDIQTFELLQKWKIPTVLLTRNIAKIDIPYVGPNNSELSQQATDHLFFHKREQIAFIGGQIGTRVHDERLRGVVASAKKHGMDKKNIIVLDKDSTRMVGYSLMQDVLKKTSKNLGVLAYNDIVAFGAMAAMRDSQISIGKEISIIGFDDVTAAKYETPALTTVHLEAELIGQRAAELILNMSKGQSPEKTQIIVKGNFVVRQSCGCKTTQGRNS